MNTRTLILLFAGIALLMAPIAMRGRFSQPEPIPAGRSEVVFWHFWGGEDRAVVDDVVRRFNESQTEYFVRAVAMPGNNLQAKLFLSVAGGDPPDLVNQDDPVLADWAQRGVIHSLDEIAPAEEVNTVRNWMLESAQRLSLYDDRMYGVCNGLDIRALYYNQTVLEQHNLSPPTTIEQLDEIASAITPAGAKQLQPFYAYLPDSRRLWAWGYVFGGEFYDPASRHVTVDTPPIRDALAWMMGYAEAYGPDNIAAFRKGDQSLPGKAFPLLPVRDDQIVGRYVMVMDGQWRVRNIVAFQDRRRELDLPVPEFGVCPLPYPATDDPSVLRRRTNAGWVNGNFFVVPRGAQNAAGAWEFSKFWIGYSDTQQAAKTCAAGGWIPVSQAVTDSESFQSYLGENPLFRSFVDLAASPNQFPTPQVVGAAMFRRTVEGAAYQAMTDPTLSPETILEDTESRIQTHLDRVARSSSGSRGKFKPTTKPKNHFLDESQGPQTPREGTREP